MKHIKLFDIFINEGAKDYGWDGGQIDQKDVKPYQKKGRLTVKDQSLGKYNLAKTLSLDVGISPRNEFGRGDWLGFEGTDLVAYVSGKKRDTVLDGALDGKYTYDELFDVVYKYYDPFRLN